MTSVCCQSQYQWNCTSVVLFVSLLLLLLLLLLLIITITMTMFMVLSSWPKSMREFTRFIWWMLTERRAATSPQIKPRDLGYESAKNWQLLFPSTIAIVIITQLIRCWYSFCRPTEGWKTGRLSWPSTAVNVRNPCPRLYIAAAVAINTTVHHHVIRTLVLAHRSWTR